jgi:hypothetical protein
VSAEVRALERIGRLLAMIATKGLTQKDQILFLSGAGYDVQGIAEMAGITSHHVSVTLHEAKQARGSRRSGRQKKKKQKK